MNQSISTVQHFKDCPLKYRFIHVVGLCRIEDESSEHHRAFGKAFHAGLEVVYNAQRAIAGLYDVVGPVAVEGIKAATLDKAKAAFIAAYPRQLDESDNAKTQASGLAAIESYYETYAAEDRSRWKILSVEAAESYDSGYVVHMDMVAEDLTYGGIYGFDWKTTKKSLTYDYFGKFEPSSQITRYVDYIRDRYGSCEGFYIRATQFGYRSRMYKGEPAGFYCKHEQQLFNVNDAQIEIEKGSALYWQRRIEESTVWDKQGFDFAWGTNTDHCPFCQFKPICRSGWRWPEDRDLILNQYRVVCGQVTESLRPCLLDVDHEGQHSEKRPTVMDDLNIEVEI